MQTEVLRNSSYFAGLKGSVSERRDMDFVNRLKKALRKGRTVELPPGMPVHLSRLVLIVRWD